MQQLAELDGQATRVDIQSSRRRKTAARRKVTVRLSERVSGRLDAAADRPGVGKSMLVEAALEQFMNPVPSAEAVLREQLDQLHARFDHLQRDMRMIAETVALHARYHLTVVPPLPESRQREAVVLGDERFKSLAEQVDRRVRQGRSLIQETIDRQNSAEHEKPGPSAGEGPTGGPKTGRNNNSSVPRDMDFEPTPAASTKTTDDIPDFLRHPKVAGGQAKPTSHTERSARVAQSPDPAPSKEKSGIEKEPPLPAWRLVLSVFLPFAAGYYLAYLFRTINAAIAPALSADFGIDAAQMGLLASVYFLVFGFAQIPIGAFLDRFGPRRVQGVLLVIAAGGATLFGSASSFPELLVARAMIGLGVAGSLMAGLKAIVTWFPRERVALANGWMIMLGSLGAVTATAPAEYLLELLGWRNLFEVLTIATVAAGGLIYMAVPEPDMGSETAAPVRARLALWSIYSDPRFLRVAPLSAACVGSSWALHSLWASAWLGDVEGLDQQGRVGQLFLMAIGLSFGAMLLGIMADRLRRRHIRTEVLLAAVAGLFIAAQLALVLRVPLPSLLPWSVVSVAGASTVLSFAVIAEYFPSEFAARANGALNLLHFGWAFIVQYGIGLVVDRWAPQSGHYPIDAYQTAFGLSIGVQGAALIWFALPHFKSFIRYLRLSGQPPLKSSDHSYAPLPEEVFVEASRGEW